MAAPRTDFEGIKDLDATGRRQAHEDDHRSLHRAHNTAIFVDDYDSVQAALDEAANRKLPTVYLNPASTYDISAMLVVPDNVTLDGGGRSLGIFHRAALNVTAALDVVVELGNYGSLVGCTLNGNFRAANGALARKNFHVLHANWFHRFTAEGAAIKAGGALYTKLVHNAVSNCAGYGLDALDAYAANPSAVYYGINHGYSEQNVWGGRMGGIRVEGYLLSVADDFELHLDGEAAVIVGGTVASRLTLQQPYFELSLGAASVLKAIEVKGSGHLSVDTGMVFGDGSPGSVFCTANAYGLSITNSSIARWDVGITGKLAHFVMPIVLGNRFVDVATVDALVNRQDYDLSMYHP